MTNDEAKALKPGDEVTIHTLKVTVEAVRVAHNSVFVVTNYGEFHASVCTKAD